MYPSRLFLIARQRACIPGSRRWLVQLGFERRGALSLFHGENREGLSLGVLPLLLGALFQQVDGVPFALGLKERRVTITICFGESCTYHPGELVHCLRHLVRQLDGLVLLLLLADLVPLRVGVLQHGLEFILVEGVDHVPEVLLVQLPAFGQLRRQIWLQFLPLRELLVELFDAELREVAHVHQIHRLQGQQLLLAGQDHPDPLLGELVHRRRVELSKRWVNKLASCDTYLEHGAEVVVEVRLALEAVPQLLDAQFHEVQRLIVGALLVLDLFCHFKNCNVESPAFAHVTIKLKSQWKYHILHMSLFSTNPTTKAGNYS